MSVGGDVQPGADDGGAPEVGGSPARSRPSSSPRPTYPGPTHIRYDQVTLHLWGDETSGEVADWMYVSSEKIHHLVFGLAPGGVFRHSDTYRTIFAADEFLYVLSGTMVLANPKTGEVHRLEKDQAAFFRRDTWHHAVSFGKDALRVLEFFAPPPAAGASSSYARKQELLVESSYRDDQWLGRWPMHKDEHDRQATIRVLRDEDLLWRLEGTGTGALASIYVSTEHLTAGKLQLQPGGATGVQSHAGEKTLYVLRGTLNVYLPDADGPNGQRWFELTPRDGFYMSEGTRHQFRNFSGESTEVLFAVAPDYLPG
jgi:mannose-6-phosphate isomerase-like protein (cupin superfamily)